jgi:hypothetical protein
MDNSRRNLIIVVVSVFVCLCVAVIGIGALGYFFPIDRILTALPTNDPVSMVTEVPTPVPSITQEALPPPTLIPSLTPIVEDPEPPPTTEDSGAPTPEPIPPEIAGQMDQIQEQVIDLRNLQPSGTVTRSLLTRDQLRQKIETDFFEDYTVEEAQVDSTVLSALGLLETGFDIFTFYQDLFSEQIAGTYDHKTKEMNVVQGIGFGGPERLTYAHEYAHALQDQNFDFVNSLNYTDEHCEEDSERCAAVQALIEGDASKLELEWFNNYSTQQDLIDIQDFYDEYESPVYDIAPDFLKEDFLFPYTFGQIFVEYLYNLGGLEAIDNAFRNVPVSTEQILHPERYPNDQPENVDIPDLVPLLGEDWSELDQGVMGEWYTFLILAHGLQPEARLDESEAQAASDGWGGDKFLVYHNNQTNELILVMHTSWESANDATQFYFAFQKHSTSRFGAPSSIDTDRIGWTHAGGYTQLSTQNQFTTWILAPDEEIAQQIWSSIYGP